jgi:hypothetical protein
VFDSIRTYERLLKITGKPETKNVKVKRHPLKKIYLETEYFPDFLGTQEAVISEVDLAVADGKQHEAFECGDDVVLSLKIFAELEFSSVILGFGLRSVQGVRVLGANNQFSGKGLALLRGANKVEIAFKLNVVAGEYFLNVGLVSDDGERLDLDQRWGVRKLIVTSTQRQVGLAYTPTEFRSV